MERIFKYFGLIMKKIAIISLSVLFLAACSSSDYDSEVSTETYQETYQTDEVQQPLTDSNAAPLEEDLHTQDAASEQPQPTESGKKVVKLSPSSEDNAQAESSASTVKVFYPEDNNAAQPQSGNFVVQVAALENEKNLLETAANLPSNQPKWENVKTVNGKQWHSLLFGNFTSSKEAKDAILRLPMEFQNMGPFVKSVDSITNSQYPTLKKLP